MLTGRRRKRRWVLTDGYERHGLHEERALAATIVLTVHSIEFSEPYLLTELRPFQKIQTALSRACPNAFGPLLSAPDSLSFRFPGSYLVQVVARASHACVTRVAGGGIGGMPYLFFIRSN